jgi:hypothetical protein
MQLYKWIYIYMFKYILKAVTHNLLSLTIDSTNTKIQKHLRKKNYYKRIYWSFEYKKSAFAIILSFVVKRMFWFELMQSQSWEKN